MRRTSSRIAERTRRRAAARRAVRTASVRETTAAHDLQRRLGRIIKPDMEAPSHGCLPKQKYATRQLTRRPK
jgi:hypothetical protein